MRGCGCLNRAAATPKGTDLVSARYTDSTSELTGRAAAVRSSTGCTGLNLAAHSGP